MMNGGLVSMENAASLPYITSPLTAIFLPDPPESGENERKKQKRGLSPAPPAIPL
jgi:hypothetical protein